MNPYCLLISFVLLSTHTLTAQEHLLGDTSGTTILNAARDIISVSKNCALITHNKSGYPKARTMDPFAPDSTMVIWLATNPRSEKVKEIKKNNKVALYYFDPGSPGYVTVRGHAEIVNTKEVKDRLWKEGWESFYKNRDTDYILIKVVPIEIEVASYRHHLLGEERTWKAPVKSMR